MAQKVELFPKENPKALMAVTTDEKTVVLLYRRLSQYNRDLTPIATERLNVTVCNGLIVGTVTAYKEQTGLVFVWDPVKNRILHVSDGKFAIQALLVKDKVYFLQCISDITENTLSSDWAGWILVIRICKKIMNFSLFRMK